MLHVVFSFLGFRVDVVLQSAIKLNNFQINHEIISNSVCVVKKYWFYDWMAFHGIDSNIKIIPVFHVHTCLCL